MARAWIKAGDEFVSLWSKVEKFFEKRRTLKRPRRETLIDDQMAIDVDEARAICFEIAEKLGFDAISCDTLITIIGNPIAALKYLVAAGTEGRKLAQLQTGELLKLPEPSDAVSIISPEKRRQRRRTREIIVEKRPSKTKDTK